MPSTPNKRKSSRHVLYKYTYFLLSVKLNDEVKLNCIFFDCEKTKISFLNWQFDFSSVVYDCSSCLCLHWLLCCPISCVPGWLVTSFSTSYLFLFLQSLRFLIFYRFSSHFLSVWLIRGGPYTLCSIFELQNIIMVKPQTSIVIHVFFLAAV